VTTPATTTVPATTTPPAEPDNLLGALRVTLAELHAAATGEAGTQVRTLKQRTGTIADVVRRGVAIIGELIAALARGMEVAANLILGADAVFALLEVVLDSLDAMVVAVGGTVAYLTSQKDGAGGPSNAADLSALDALRGPLAEAKAFLGESGMVAAVLPNPSELGGIRRELANLLGSRVDPKLKTTGSLGALGAAIAPPGAPAPTTNSAAAGGPQGR
jgi:hypothetical protein